MVRVVLIAMSLCATFLLGCAGDEVVARTQLMLVADTDIANLDQVAFDVRQGARERTSGRLAVDSSDAPFTMAVLREDGSLGPLTVSASGYRGDTLLVARTAVVSFVPGKTLTVVLHLVQSCIASQCESGETCTERGCEPADAGTPSDWNGTAPTLGDVLDASMPGPDAGTGPDGASAQDAGDASNPIWMQCNGRNVDVNSDLEHCGRCSRPCRTAPGSGANTMPACVEGTCSVACRPLWGDCDGDARNGCEKSLVFESENCGACGMTCTSEEYCRSGVCRPNPN